MPSLTPTPGTASLQAEGDPAASHYEQLLREHEQARLAAEAAVARSNRLLAITAALSRALTPERVADLVLEAALAITGAIAGHVSLLDPLSEDLHMLSCRGYSEQAVSGWGRIPLTMPAPITDAVRLGEPVVVGSLEDLAERYPTFARSKHFPTTRALAAVPITLDANVVGVLGLSFGAPVALGDEDRTFLMTLCGLCAQALERARLTAAERAALAAADEALALLDTVIDSAPVGLAVMDRDFRYTRINRSLAAFNGRPPTEHIGRLASELYPLLAELWAPHWRQVLATGEPLPEVEMSATGRDGKARHALVSYYPVRVGDGPVVGVGMVVVDITERKAAEEERQQLLSSAQGARAAAQEAQARAEAALLMRENFLSVAAHELRSPLTSLIGQAQLLERRLAQAGMLNEANGRSLQVVIGQSRRLSYLIGDLLDGANLASGVLVLDQKPVDLGPLLRRLIEEARPLSMGHRLDCAVEGEPLRVRGDALRLEQVFQNLLANAVKYSPAGGAVALTARRVGGAVEVAVADSGMGIPPDAVPRLFERFYRVERPETRGVSGVGVGLYLVGEIVRLHGGAVSVRSALGEGSTFVVTLPLDGGGAGS